MSHRTTPLAENEFYHIYSRGVDKRKIFLDNEDERRFINLLYFCNGSVPIVYREIKNMSLSSVERGEPQTAIGAYCLMPNHFHILVRETRGSGVSNFMRKLLTAYSKYFNKKYERTGALFGSEFKSEHLNTDEYLKYIFSYIHLNPLKILDPEWRRGGLAKPEAERFLENYVLSSYLDYAGLEREESLILNRLAFPEYFPSQDSFREEIQSWLTLNPEIYQRET